MHDGGVLIVDGDEQRRSAVSASCVARGVPLLEVPDAFAAMAALGRSDFRAIVVAEGKRHLSLRGLCQLARRRHPAIRLFVMLRSDTDVGVLRDAIGVDVEALEASLSPDDIAVRVGEGIGIGGAPLPELELDRGAAPAPLELPAPDTITVELPEDAPITDEIELDGLAPPPIPPPSVADVAPATGERAQLETPDEDGAFGPRPITGIIAVSELVQPPPAEPPTLDVSTADVPAPDSIDVPAIDVPALDVPAIDLDAPTLDLSAPALALDVPPSLDLDDSPLDLDAPTIELSGPPSEADELATGPVPTTPDAIELREIEAPEPAPERAAPAPPSESAAPATTPAPSNDSAAPASEPPASASSTTSPPPAPPPKPAPALPVPSEVVLEGSLEEGGGAALLMALFSQELCGRLLLTNGSATTTIFIYEGEPVWADVPGGDATLYERLVQRRLLAPDAPIAPVPNGQLLHSLGRQGVLTQAQVQDFMRGVVRDSILELATSNDGSYRFIEDAAFRKTTPLFRLNPFGLILESRRKGMTPDRLLAIAHELQSCYLLPGPGLAHAARKIAPFVRDIDLSTLITGEKTVGEFSGESGLDIMMGTLVMIALDDARLVRIAEQPLSQTAAARAVPAGIDLGS